MISVSSANCLVLLPLTKNEIGGSFLTNKTRTSLQYSTRSNASVAPNMVQYKVLPFRRYYSNVSLRFIEHIDVEKPALKPNCEFNAASKVSYLVSTNASTILPNKELRPIPL